MTNSPKAGVKDRVFPTSYRRIDGGARQQRIRWVECGSATCQNRAEIVDNTTTALPSDSVARKFRQKNWEISAKKPDDDRCPDCLASERAARRREIRIVTATDVPLQGSSAILTGITDMNDTPPPKLGAEMPTIEVPKEMSIDERRIIFAKLSEVYLSAEAGYAVPWNDNVVAKDLGVPVAWVATVRDGFFGPARDNGEVRELLAKIETIGEEIAGKIRDFEQWRREGAALIKQGQDLSSNINALQRAADHLATAAARIEKVLR